MSKIYERGIHNSLSSYAETISSNFISGYKKSNSLNHVLLKLIENWKNFRDNKNFVGAVLMDLSIAYDCSSWLTCCKTLCIQITRRCSKFCAFILKTKNIRG